MAKGIYISDSIHGLTQLSEYEKKIIASVGFNRLHDVYQNSTVYLTYPSNRTKRFEHSIGTMGLCSKMFYNSVTNSKPETLKLFYEIYYKELNDVLNRIGKEKEYETIWKKSPKGIPDLKWDNFQLSLIPSNVPSQYKAVHVILIQAIRAAALLHDIGHPPYSHVVERAMGIAFKEQIDAGVCKDTKYTENIVKYITDSKRKLHELMGDEISRSILKGILVKTEDSHKIIFETLILETVLRIFGNESKFSCLHRIIDNSLDGDRLDYVTRDPANSGMNVGSIDYNRIIMDMRIVFEDGNPLFCVPLKAVNAVEDFLKRRYDLYKNIIYHHRVIKTDYLMEYTVANLIKEYLAKEAAQKQDAIVNLEENEAIPFDISGLWAPLGLRSLAERDCILSQWNDSWLMTVLKKIYYEEYYNIIDKSSEKYVISKQFAELLNNQRNYKTLIKRNEDFKHLDDGVRRELVAKKDSIQKKINELVNKSEEYLKSNQDKCNEKNSKKLVDVAEFFKQIMISIQAPSDDDNTFVMARLYHRKQLLSLENIEIDVKKIVEEVCREKLGKSRFLNSIVVFKEISPGVNANQPIYFCDNNDQLYTLDQASGVVMALRTENLFRPVFYIYLLTDIAQEIDFEEKKDLLSEIGNRIGSLVYGIIIGNLDKLIGQL